MTKLLFLIQKQFVLDTYCFTVNQILCVGDGLNQQLIKLIQVHNIRGYTYDKYDISEREREAQ